MLPAFWEACQPYMAAELRDTYDAAAMRDFATGVQACEDQDPVELLEVLYERVQSGCVLRTVGLSHGDANHGSGSYSALRITVTKAHVSSVTLPFHSRVCESCEWWCLLGPGRVGCVLR